MPEAETGIVGGYVGLSDHTSNHTLFLTFSLRPAADQSHVNSRTGKKIKGYTATAISSDRIGSSPYQ